MNFLNLRNMVWYWLDDLNGGYFTATQVNVWLNNAQRECQKQLLQAGENFYMKCVSTSLVVDQNEYILPTDFLKEHRLEIVLSGSAPNEEIQVLDAITPMQQDMIANGHSTPEGYFLKKNRIVLYPYPDQALLMRMLYSPLVADMVSDIDLPDVPTEYQEYLAVLATLDGLYKDGRPTNDFMAKKGYYLELMKQTAQRRREDKGRYVVQTRADGVESLF